MDVIFEPPRGRPFSIEVGYFDTVLEIKEKIQKYQAIPISNQTLIFNGNVLQDNRDVEHCDILQSSHIQLIISPEFDKAAVEIESLSLPKNSKVQLNIKTPTSKFHAPLEMDVNNTTGQLKEKTQKMEALPINRLMIHSSGTELQDHRSLRDYDLSDNSNLDVSFKGSPTNSTAARPGPTMAGSKKLKLMVLAKCGTKKIPIEVNASDNVGELRKELQKLQQRLHFHLPNEGYFFIYEQNVMDDDRSFRWHRVGQGDTIEIFNGSVTGGS